MGSGRSKRRALSLTSVLVTVSIIAVLAGALTATLGRARSRAHEAVCANNLKQIALALEMFHQDHGEYPDDYPEGAWVEKILPYLDDKAVLFCPEHGAEEDDGPECEISSYASLYVKRGEFDGHESRFILGCPRHRDRGLSGVLFGKKSVDTVTTDVVKWVSEDGVVLGEVAIGDTVMGDTALGGRLEFADGSVAELSEDLEVRVLQSFRQADGTLYSVIRVMDESVGTVTCTVNKGSKFDVVTPAIIAGAEGTAFWVRTWMDDGGAVHAEYGITEGRIYVVDKANGKHSVISPDPIAQVAEGEAETPDPPPVTTEEQYNKKHEEYAKKAQSAEKKDEKYSTKADEEEARGDDRKAEKLREKAYKYRQKSWYYWWRAQQYLNG